MGTGNSTGQHRFSQIPQAEIQRSTFDRSHGLKTTFDAGDLVPIFVDEALPGDTFSCNPTLFARLATPIYPIMDNMYLDTFYFAVPVRLIWENWQRFNGEQTNPEDSTDYLVPIMDSAAGGHALYSLADYFGMPTMVPNYEHSSLWHRAYNLIWDQWFRDQNLHGAPHLQMDDGPDLKGNYPLRKRGKRHDYFTSCLPFPQKGPAVELPLGDTAPVTGTISGTGPPEYQTAEASGMPYETAGGSQNNVAVGQPLQNADIFDWDDPNLEFTGNADLSAATASTINSIRQAFQIQRLYERDARGGTRYTEIVRSHFGVTSPDQRLQRPEFLGGNTTRVHINPVPQTAPNDGEGSVQGNLAGFGTAESTGGGFSKSFVEHSIIIGLVSARADLNYQQGLPRMFSRRTRWDFYWPALAHLGEQAVLNKEIYTQGSGDPDADEAVFGYQERFAEMRYKPSSITGLMRSNNVTSLDPWHLAQEFDNLPVLDDQFIDENPPMDRIIAIPTEPHFILDCYFKLNCARPMPTYGVPGQMDHF